VISDLNFKPPLLLQSQGDASAKFPLDIKVFAPGTDKRDIYRLRYRAFIEDGVITPREDRLFSDEFDECPTTSIIAAYSNGTCVGSFRLAFSETGGATRTMPCQMIFDEVDLLELAGFHNRVEFTRMVVAPELTNTSFRTTLYATLVRAGMMVAHAARADYGLISIHPDKVRFYEMMCGFREIARAATYPGINAPAVLLGRDFRALDQKRVKQNAFFRISTAEIASARQKLFPGQVHVVPEVAVA
jgi:Acetyltransferase (GNAT) domain